MPGFSNITGQDSIMFADNASFDGTERNGIIDQDGEIWISHASLNPGGTHIDAGKLVSPLGTLSIGYANPNITLDLAGGQTGIDQVTANSGTAVADVNGNINILGLGETITAASVNTETIFSPRTAKFVVDPTLNNGTQQTIAAALTAAVSGETIFIRPGTYTENLTLKAGVNLAAYSSDGQNGNVTIVGNCTATFAGTCVLSGIRLQTNSSNLLTVSGSEATIVYLIDCYLNCTNNTGISYTSSSASSAIECFRCNGNIATTGISLFAATSTGDLRFLYCDFFNTGATTTASTSTACDVLFRYSRCTFPLNISSTADLFSNHSVFETDALNVTSLTVVGGQVSNSYIASGSAVSVSVGVGSTFGLTNSSIFTTNGTAISGAGVIEYNDVCFGMAGTNLITTTTRTSTDQGTFTPTILGSAVAGTTTYTVQSGFYTRTDNLVTIQGRIVITGATGTGDAVIGGFPFSITNTTNYDPVGTIAISSATWTLPVGTTYPVIRGNINTTNSVVAVFGSATGGNLQMSNSAATFLFTLIYRIS